MELSTLVREADKPGLDGVTRFLVPSMEVQKHLRDFNRVERVTAFHPGARPGIWRGTDMPPRLTGRNRIAVRQPAQLPGPDGAVRPDRAPAPGGRRRSASERASAWSGCGGSIEGWIG